MEEINHNEQEITIAMSSSIEENIRKVYEATKKGCIESLKKLMEEDPYLIQNVVTSSSNNSNQTHPVLHLSISHGHLEFTRLLLHHNSQLAAEVDSFQRTPLHLASKLGDMDIVEALLEKNTSACFVYDNNGLIPLHYAVISGQMDIMQELIKARPRSLWMKLNNNGQTVLHLCVESNNLEGMKLLIETYVNDDEDFLNTADDKGNTILDLSIMLRQSEMVGYLLSIPEIKTRTSIANFTASNATKESLISEKAQEIRNPERQLKKDQFVSKGGWYKGDWVEEVQGTMMLVATVIATVAFQAGVNPPGGVWQQDTQFNSNIISNQNYPWNILYKNLHNGTVLFAGTAIFAYQLPITYLTYSISNMVSFLASVSVILLIISRVPLKNKVCGFVLVLAMCAAVVFLALGYIQGTAMVNSYILFHFGLTKVYVGATCFMIAIVGLVVLFHVIRFLIWVLKTLFCTFTSMLKSHRFNHTTPS